jgi:hypothetical protein
MPHLSCLGCEPARHGCVNGAAGARSEFKRTGVQHGVQKRCRLCAILLLFRPPTVSVATCTLTSGARRSGRRAETQVEAAGKHRHLSLGRPSLPELRAAPGLGGLQPSGNEARGWQGGRLCRRRSWQRIDWSSEVNPGGPAARRSRGPRVQRA